MWKLVSRNRLTPWSRVLLEKLIIPQLVKKFPAFYVTRRFIILFPRAHHLSLFWVRCIHSTPSHPVSLRSILILSSHLRLGLPSGLFPAGFVPRILYVFIIFLIRATWPAHLILPDLITLIIFGEAYKRDKKLKIAVSERGAGISIFITVSRTALCPAILLCVRYLS